MAKLIMCVNCVKYGFVLSKLLLSNSSEAKLKEIENILHSLGLQRNHPDLLYLDSSEKLGIEQSRKIKVHFLLKPFQKKGKVVVLEEVSNLTPEAQNAILKTLEEPPLNALLILGARSENSLLPTLLSRCQIIRLHNGSFNSDKIFDKYFGNLEKLLDSDIPQRFEYIEKLKDRGEFLQFLVKQFRQKLYEDPKNQKLVSFVKQLLQAEKWASQNVNIRGILEYLMLVMPNRSR